jgi:hypothetical protein
MKGLVTFYVNYDPEKGEKVEPLFDIIRDQNKELITILEEDGYKVAFVPVCGESARVEKMDFITNIVNSTRKEEK